MQRPHSSAIVLAAFAAVAAATSAAAADDRAHTKPPVIFFKPTVIGVGSGPTNASAAKLVYTTAGSALEFDPVICNPSYISLGYPFHRLRKHMTVGYVSAWGDSEPLQCTLLAYWNPNTPGAPYAVLTINVSGGAAARANGLRRHGFGLPPPSR